MINYDAEILSRLRLARLDDEWARANRRAIFRDNLKGWAVPGACLLMLATVLARLIGGF